MNQARILGAELLAPDALPVLPMMKPIILIALIIRAIEAFKLFDAVVPPDAGRPGRGDHEHLALHLRRDVRGTPLGLRQLGGDHRPDLRQHRSASGRSVRSSMPRRRRSRSSPAPSCRRPPAASRESRKRSRRRRGSDGDGHSRYARRAQGRRLHAAEALAPAASAAGGRALLCDHAHRAALRASRSTGW